MADLHLLGKVSREEQPFFDNKYYFYIDRVDQGGEEDSVVFHKGANMLEHVMLLWKLIDPEVRKRFQDFQHDVIEKDSNELDSGGYLITVDQVRFLLELINDLDVKLEKFLGADRKVLPEYVDFIRRRIASLTFDNGELDRDSIYTQITSIRMMKNFLNQAIELNYPLAIG